VKRSPIRRVSKARAKENRLRAKVFEEAWGPRPWKCHLRDNTQALLGLGLCFGEVNAHEIVKRSQGGSITDPENAVPLCGAHNTAVDDFPVTAKYLGLVRNPNKELGIE
jgi:hypothetical protein